MVLRASEALKQYKKKLLFMEIAARRKNREWYRELYTARDDLWYKTTVSNHFTKNLETYEKLVNFHYKLQELWIE